MLLIPVACQCCHLILMILWQRLSNVVFLFQCAFVGQDDGKIDTFSSRLEDMNKKRRKNLASLPSTLIKLTVHLYLLCEQYLCDLSYACAVLDLSIVLVEPYLFGFYSCY